MKNILIFVFLFHSNLALGDLLSLPIGKGKCPHFSFEAESGWYFKVQRKAGDSWQLIDSDKKVIARFDYKISNTDQKQLPEVESKKIKLANWVVQKFTVTTSFPNPREKATEGLITSYTFLNGKLKGLVVMTSQYDAKMALDRKLETLLNSIK